LCLLHWRSESDTQYQCTKFFQSNKKPTRICNFICWYRPVQKPWIDWYYRSLHDLWTGIYQHSRLYRGIVKVMWKVFNQLKVCFLFWYTIKKNYGFAYSMVNYIVGNPQLTTLRLLFTHHQPWVNWQKHPRFVEKGY
jgi:hypothetical protein